MTVDRPARMRSDRAMRRALPLFFVLTACATGTSAVGGQGGGASGGAGGQGGGGSGGSTGPCKNADDCASLSGACTVGSCVNGACEAAPANEGGPCDDGKTCTTSDRCEAGACTGDLKFCPSITPCHIGVCDVDTDACTEIPGNDGAPCNDEDACTSVSTCSAGACVGSGQVDCGFLDDACNEGACDSQIGCYQVAANEGEPCDDALFCTEGEACLAGSCTGGLPKACVAPGDVCKTGACDEAQNQCVVVNGPDGVPCDDGNLCTSGEACAAGTCAGGALANPGAACDDGDACTTASVCAGVDCVGTQSIGSCTNGDQCCPAGCTEATDDDCAPACCGDWVNPAAPTNNCSQGAAWIAIQYVPSCTVEASSLALHTDGGGTAILADAGGLPGAVLWQGNLGAPDAQGWATAAVSPPVDLQAGQVYWIAEDVGPCSQAASGQPQPYYGSFASLAGPWDGPFNGDPWTFKVSAAGCP